MAKTNECNQKNSDVLRPRHTVSHFHSHAIAKASHMVKPKVRGQEIQGAWQKCGHREDRSIGAVIQSTTVA